MTISPDRTYRLGLLMGDGIGPEIVPASVAIVDAAFEAVGLPAAEWVELPFGAPAIETHGTAVPESTLATLAELDAWLLGPHDSAAYPAEHRAKLNPSGTIRKHFDLYANLRPARAYEGGNAIVPGTDLVIVRENTQGSTPTAAPSPAPANSCRSPDAPSRWASSPAPRVRADRQGRIRTGPAPQGQADDRAQGQCAEDDHRPVPGRVSRDRGATTPTCRWTTTTSTR